MMADYVEYSSFGNPQDLPQAPASGSKRKRAADVRTLFPDVHDQEEGSGFTPKRARHETQIENESPAPGRNIRRKKGKYSLATLHRNHGRPDLRASKFQEGSMNDKPSDKPPSVFIRSPSNKQIRTHQSEIDELMEDYHDDAGGMRQSVEEQPPTEYDNYTTTTPSMQNGNRESGLFRFGRMVASSFNPVNVWKSFAKTYEETRDEITIANIEANRRKVDMKTMAERKYAEMKDNGELSPQKYTAVKHDLTEAAADDDQELLEEVQPNRDSAVVIPEDTADKIPEGLRIFHRTDLQPPLQKSRDDVETPIQSTYMDKTIKSRKSMFHVRRPSFNSIKKVRSDYNIGESVPRFSSSSLSPEKPAPLEASTLHRSHSKRDLQRQHKLTKRVSDLETKLQDARRELTVAINTASPLPELPTRFEKYTPKFKLSRPKFVPGALPSLPSERLLFPTLRRSSKTLNETSITQASEDNITPAAIDKADDVFEDGDDTNETPSHHVSNATTDFDRITAMDPSSYMAEQTEAQPTVEVSDYSALDEKLNALEASHKASQKTKKTSKSKKRKSLGDEEKLFKPGKDDDDEDGNWNGGDKPKKKRKATAKKNVSTTKEGTDKKDASSKKSIANLKAAVKDAHSKPLPPTPAENAIEHAIKQQAEGRPSLDSVLEPIDEEEPVLGASTDNSYTLAPPATQTVTHRSHRSHSPVNFSRASVRSRSPNPRTILSQYAHEDDKAVVSQSQRSGSPPPSPEHSRPNNVVNETVTAIPGEGAVPSMPTSSEQIEVGRAQAANEHWEWPEDVF